MRNFIPKSHFSEGERTDGGGERGEGGREGETVGEGGGSVSKTRQVRHASQSVRRTHSRLSTSLLKTAIPHRMADDDYGNDDSDGYDGFSEFKQGRQGRRERKQEAAKQPTKLRECQFSPRQKRARGSMRGAGAVP